MNQAKIGRLATHTRMIIWVLKTRCVVHFSNHDELHPAFSLLRDRFDK